MKKMHDITNPHGNANPTIRAIGDRVKIVKQGDRGCVLVYTQMETISHHTEIDLKAQGTM